MDIRITGICRNCQWQVHHYITVQNWSAAKNAIKNAAANIKPAYICAKCGSRAAWFSFKRDWEHEGIVMTDLNEEQQAELQAECSEQTFDYTTDEPNPTPQNFDSTIRNPSNGAPL